ncbi:MAG: phosphoribosylamine--glycine ligase [Candidatus Obscuribacterales bacterium]|nr:phosphoribosylamine--glycine ligase [Candidatus Obscuribacterales bacterium]
MLPNSALKILLVGGGGREHAICWKLGQSPLVQTVYCAPGNGGTAVNPKSENVDIQVSDFSALAQFAQNNKVDLVVVGPDNPLADGIVDYLENQGLRTFGPRQKLAQIEASKVYAKNFMTEHGIPTARFAVASTLTEAEKIVIENDWARVVKVDGLALGKGVFVCDSQAEAEAAVREIFQTEKFGAAGAQVVLEEKLIGEEISLLMFADGKDLALMPPCQDHKRRFDDDKGPNTGGMGAYSPVALYAQVKERVEAEILLPLKKAMAAGQFDFKGVLYAGLLVTAYGGELRPYVLEFNARFGDPETQVILPLLRSDLLPILWAVTEGSLDQVEIAWQDGAACTVVLAAENYPESSSKNEPVIVNSLPANTFVFHAGTKRSADKLLTNGGRVFSVTAIGNNLSEAVELAYAGIKSVSFAGMSYRRDIARRALAKCH